MHLRQGVIHLVHPVFGRSCLTGPAVIGPTWIEYARTAQQVLRSQAMKDSESEVTVTAQSILIPISNVLAIVLEDEVEEEEATRPGQHIRQRGSIDRESNVQDRRPFWADCKSTLISEEAPL